MLLFFNKSDFKLTNVGGKRFFNLQVNKYNYPPMNKIISKTYFSTNVVKFEVEAPLIAKSRKSRDIL